MVAAIAVFLLVVGLVMGGYYALTQLPDWLAARRLDRRLREVSLTHDPLDGPKTVLTEQKVGPLPAIDKALGGANSSDTAQRKTRLIRATRLLTTPRERPATARPARSVNPLTITVRMALSFSGPNSRTSSSPKSRTRGLTA